MIPVNAAYKKTIFYYCYGQILMFIHVFSLALCPLGTLHEYYILHEVHTIVNTISGD